MPRLVRPSLALRGIHVMRTIKIDLRLGAVTPGMATRRRAEPRDAWFSFATDLLNERVENL